LGTYGIELIKPSTFKIAGRLLQLNNKKEVVDMNYFLIIIVKRLVVERRINIIPAKSSTAV